jgi:hypothetical protein
MVWRDWKGSSEEEAPAPGEEGEEESKRKELEVSKCFALILFRRIHFITGADRLASKKVLILWIGEGEDDAAEEVLPPPPLPVPLEERAPVEEDM